MRYLVLLYDDEANATEPGSAAFDAEMAAYAAFDELAGDAVVGGEALEPTALARTVRHDGGRVRVTNGPFAETVEALGGFYVLEAPNLDDAIELARNIPAAATGAVEVRPMVEWFDRGAGTGDAAAPRWMATIHGPESPADVPGTDDWDRGAAEHGRFVAQAGDAVTAGGALQPAASATTVRVRDGELLVTDGPFAEATEVVGGLYLLRGDADAVAEVAARIPVGDGGAVELRPVMQVDG